MASDTSSSETLSADKGNRNKRKYRADQPVVEETKYVSLSDNDLPLYEFPCLKLEPSQTQKENIGCEICENSDPLKLGLGLSTGVGSSGMNLNQVGEEKKVLNKFVKWTNLKENELEQLVLHELETIFQNAIKEIVGFGYSEEVSYRTVLKSGVYYGPKDILSNIVDNALFFIRNEGACEILNGFSFEDLEQMQRFVLAELVSSLREVRTLLSRGDALWRLLLCDMDVAKACSWAGASKPPQPDPKTEANSSQFSFSATSSSESCECKATDCVNPTKEPVNPAKTSVKSKRNLGTRRELILRQKALDLERPYRSYGSKSSSRSGKNLNNFGGLVLDKNLKTISESAGVNFRNASVKVTKPNTIEEPQETKAETENKTETETKTETEKKTETITATDMRVMRLLEKEKILKELLVLWNDWVNEKVMEVARRLGKDKAELKALRQEIDEGERLRKEKLALEENTMKKLLEMENALRKASGQMERANLAVRRLEVENVWLRREMESARSRAKEEAAVCREGEKREREAAAKVRGLDREKGMLRDEQAAEKRKVAEADREVGLAQDRRDQQEARFKQEEKAKDELLREANSIRKEREELEASAKQQESAVKTNTEVNLQNFKDNIQKLENEISKLRLKNDSSKIAAMRRGVEPLSPKEEVTGTVVNLESFTGVKRERECVMCLSEEMSVVFLPCAHQVVCANCNEMHEKQGMRECPSCRTAIQQRISVKFGRK